MSGQPTAVSGMILLLVAGYIGALVALCYLMARFVTLLPVIVIEQEYNPFTAIARAWRDNRQRLEDPGFPVPDQGRCDDNRPGDLVAVALN